jgi:hypothetical protein
VELEEKVKRALQALDPTRIELRTDGGISGYVVSPRFRSMEFIDRQKLVSRALREPPARLKAGELRQVVAIAALTPEELAGHETD